MLRGGELKGVGGINKGTRDLTGIEEAKGKVVCDDEVYEVPSMQRKERWGFPGKRKKREIPQKCFLTTGAEQHKLERSFGQLHRCDALSFQLYRK